MPASAVEVLHDDGRWSVAQLLGQHRDRETGDWRCGVRYSVAPSTAYQCVGWADQCRPPAPEQVDQELRGPVDEGEPEPGPGDPAQAWLVTSVGAGVLVRGTGHVRAAVRD